MSACANPDGYLCMLKGNCTEIEGWQVSLSISNQLKARGK